MHGAKVKIDSVDKYVMSMCLVLTTVVEGMLSVYFKSFYQAKDSLLRF
jgi:hypothetical protein